MLEMFRLYIAAETSGVPRIPKKWLEVVVFIYPDKRKLLMIFKVAERASSFHVKLRAVGNPSW
jgi:hypothetical protein